MRDPLTVYRDPLKSNRMYMLREVNGIWRVMEKTGRRAWLKVAGLDGSEHKFIAEETMTTFAYDNGLYEEVMDEDLI